MFILKEDKCLRKVFKLRSLWEFFNRGHFLPIKTIKSKTMLHGFHLSNIKKLFFCFTENTLSQLIRENVSNVSKIICLCCKDQTKIKRIYSIASAGIATRCGLEGPGFETVWGARYSWHIGTVRRAHPASCTMGTAAFPRYKAAEAWRWTPLPSSAEFEYGYSYTCTCPLCLLGMLRDNADTEEC